LDAGKQRLLAHLLLLHQLVVGAVVDDVTAEDGRSQDSVDLLGVDVLQLAVQDEVVARGTDRDSGFLSEQYKGEDVPKLKFPWPG
jgi:hypothetical protein